MENKRKAKKKNPNGSGGVTKKIRNGKTYYVARFTYYTSTGEPKRKEISRSTMREATAELAASVAARNKGEVTEFSNMTVAEFAEQHLARIARGKSQNTDRVYRQEMGHALCYIGRLRLQEVRARHILDLRDSLEKHGYTKKRRGKLVTLKYDSQTVSRTLQRVRRMFDDALTRELVSKNPAVGIKVERVGEANKIARSLELTEVDRLFDHLDTYPIMGVCLQLILLTGLRRGEALGLRWEDVELDVPSPHIHVSRNYTRSWGAPFFSNGKTKASRRVVPLPESMIPKLIELRATHMEVFGADVSQVYLFTNLATGNIYYPVTINRTMRAATLALGLPNLRVHDLRHTYASLVLSMGKLKLEQVSVLLGHSDITFTMRRYRHVLDHERSREAFDILKEIRESSG